EQDVTADEWIAQLPRQQAAPRDDGLRPVPSHPRFKRQIKKPGQAGNENPSADCQDQGADRLYTGSDMAATEPERHRQPEHPDTRDEGTLTAPAPMAIVAASECGGANNQRDGEDDAKDLPHLVPRIVFVLFHPQRLRPVADQGKENQLAMPRAGFYAERAVR